MAWDDGGTGREIPRLDFMQALGGLMTGPGHRPMLWERRGRWQVGFRWGVTPTIVVSAFAGRWLGFEFSFLPILVVAAGIAGYNAAFSWVFYRYGDAMRLDTGLDRRITLLQAVCDYVAAFLLIHLTGGAWSPLALFLIFHVVIVAIQFYHRIAYLFATWAAGGMGLLLLGQVQGWLPTRIIAFRGRPLVAHDRPDFAAVYLIFFTATLYLTTAMVGQIMRLLRNRVGKLADATTELALANQKLHGLYAIVRTIGSERRVEPILRTVTSELATVLDIPAVAVQMLDSEGRALWYAAATGLSDTITSAVTHLDRSPLHRRVLAGATLLHGPAAGEGSLPLQPEIASLGIHSAAMAPLSVEGRAIGTLGIYSDKPGRFQGRDLEFLRLAADLVAIAIEDARANEEIEALMRERTQFMLEVAHNLRAPLGAALNMQEVLREGYLGEVNDKQREILDKIDVRLRALHRMIGELLTIGRTRDRSREIPDVVVDLTGLARHAQATFEKQAADKRLSFSVVAEPDLPPVDSGADLLDQVVENLVSNAIKYTPEGGEVSVRFSRNGPEEVRIEVRDNGIGIPEDEQRDMFREFFRATNAKKHTSEGTGLGLAIVKQSVERHRGRLKLTSAEGRGTTVVIDLPVRQPGRAAG